MLKNGMTIREATAEWLKEMSKYPYDMISELMQNDPCDWTEISMPSYGDRVYVFDIPEDGTSHTGEIVNVISDADCYLIHLDDGISIEVEHGDFKVEYDGALPMWGWLWQFDYSADTWWVEEGEGVRALSECGFRVYESEKFGVFFGIDGAGYDFYESHWIPLYKRRGLQWHDKDAEKWEQQKGVEDGPLKTFRIVHREELVGHFFVEAKDKYDAVAVYRSKASNGEIVFDDLEIVDSDDIAYLEEE